MAEAAVDVFAAAAAEPLASLTSLGKALIGDLKEAGFETLGDLWFHFPLRFEDRTEILRIGALRPGAPAQFVGTVDHSEVSFRRRRTLLVSVSDGSGRILLRFFHFKQAQADQLKAGTRVLVYGDPRPGGYSLEIVHPRYKVLGKDEDVALEDSLRPVYPKSEGLGNARLQRAVERALERLPEGGDGVLASLLPKGWPTLSAAVRSLHRPRPRPGMLYDLYACEQPPRDCRPVYIGGGKRGCLRGGSTGSVRRIRALPVFRPDTFARCRRRPARW